MKRRFLPFGYFILTIGITTTLISATINDGELKALAKSESASEYLSSLRVNQVTGTVPAASLIRALNQVAQSDMNRSAATEFDWNSIGPNNVGGRTRALLFDSGDPTWNTVYAGSVMGGVYKSTTGGMSWSKMNHENPSLNVTCLAQGVNGEIYAGTGEGFTVEEFTVLGDWNYGNGFLGKGIFKCTDGENWELIPSTTPVMDGTDIEWGYVNEIATTPAGNGLYAATNTGLKYSPDGGATWQLAKTAAGTDLNLLSKDVKTGSNGIVVAEVNNLCYISADGNPANFTIHSSDSTYEIPEDNVGRIEFAIAPTNPDVIYALVVTTNGALYNVYRSSDKGANWSIIGPGGSDNFNIFNTGSNVSDGIGLYNCTIEVFPDNPDHILIGGRDMWEGIKIQDEGFFDWTNRSTGTGQWLYEFFLFTGHNAYKFKPGTADECLIATNGGISAGFLDPVAFTFEFRNRDYIGSQFYSVGYTNDKRIVLGGAQDLGTIFIDGKSNPADPYRGEDIWTTAANLPDGATGGYAVSSLIYPATVIYSRTPHPAKNGNIETFVRRNEYLGGPDWSASMFDDKYASTAFLSPFALWESFDNPLSRDSAGLKVTKNYAAGSSIWMESSNANRPFQYITPVALQSGDSITVQDPISARFFIGGDERVVMSPHVIQFDREPEWWTIANASTGFEGTASCLAYSGNANHLFVGTLEGKFYRISNIAYAYDEETGDVTSQFCVISTRRIPIYLPNTTTEITQVITSVSVDPNNDERVIITLGNYDNDHYVYYCDNALDENPVFRSVQGTAGSGGLPQMPAYSSLFEMDPDNDLVFVGTEYGLYYSENISSVNPTWASTGENVGKLPVMMLKQQTVRKANDTIYFDPQTYNVVEGVNNYGVIYGATYGQGLVMMDDLQKPVGIDDPSHGSGSMAGFSLYPNPVGNMVTAIFELGHSEKVTFQVFDLGGRMVQAQESGLQAKGEHQVRIDCSKLPAGSYIVRMVTAGQSSSAKLIVR